MEKPLIEENLENALHEQIAHEITNSHIYLYICGYLRNKGFDNLAKLFMNQYEEEQSHAKIIFDLLTDLNTNFSSLPIESGDFQINSIVDVAKLYLEREILTTESLKEIRDLAMDEGNVIVEERMREMIKLQQNEMEESTTFMDKAEICGSNWMNVLIWDGTLKG
jgi:ferritin